MLKTNQVEKIKVWERGQITIPKDLREELEIKENDILYAEKLGRAILLKPEASGIEEIQRKMAAIMQKNGLTVKDLLDEDDDIEIDEED